MSDPTELEGELVTTSRPPSTGEVVIRDVGMGEMSQLLGSGSVLEVSNFDGTPMERWELSSLATDGESVKSGESVNKEIEVKYFYMHKVDIVDKKTGEVNSCVRTVLIDPDRTCYSFVSAGVAMSVYRMCMQFGKLPFNPPLKVRVESRAVGGGQKMLVLVPVITKKA